MTRNGEQKFSAKDVENIAVMQTDIKYIRSDVGEIKFKLEKNYATKEELAALIRGLDSRLRMIERIVYGVCGLIGIGLVGAGLKLLIVK